MAEGEANAFVMERATRHRGGCRGWLVVVLLILVAVQAVFWTGLWESVYIARVLPEAIRVGDDYVTPPQLEVRDHYIVGLDRPVDAHACAGNSGS